jgi:DnaJ-class molecular chaperone
MAKLLGGYILNPKTYTSEEETETKIKLRSIDLAYSILDVKCYTPMNEVKKRYLQLMKEFHPDRYSGDAKTEMEEKTKLINWAYSEIKAIA